MDNLNTHSQNSLYTTFGTEAGQSLWSRFTVHYTPKHGSWLNPAEIEASLWSRECLGRQGSAPSPNCAAGRPGGTRTPIADAGRSTGDSQRSAPASCSSSTRSVRSGLSTSIVVAGGVRGAAVEAARVRGRGRRGARRDGIRERHAVSADHRVHCDGEAVRLASRDSPCSSSHDTRSQQTRA